MIYELRAYIGKTKMPLRILFTNMEAAQRKVEKLRKVCAANNVPLFGKISVLTAKGDTYESIEELTQFINPSE